MFKLNWFVVFESIIFLFSFLFIKCTLPTFHSLAIKQLVREDGPKSHLYKKHTPTMGGLFFILFLSLYAITAYILKPNLFNDGYFLSLYILFMAYGMLGFFDDLLKIKFEKGLVISVKIFLQIIIGLLWSYYCLFDHIIYIPGLLSLQLTSFQSIFWGCLVIVGSVNAINFTDGLDGLMVQTVLIVLLGFVSIAYVLDQPISLLSAGVFTCMLLLMIYPFNVFPAKIFVGDTGSMAIGAMVSGLALLQNIEIPLVLMGIIFVIETLSVAIQIISFKLFKKRVFKMAPIHHAFELSGWQEPEIVRLFSIITLIGTFIALWWVIG